MKKAPPRRVDHKDRAEVLTLAGASTLLMERLRYSPHNRQNLVRWLLDKDTPRGPDPRQWVEQADMYQEKYGHDDEIEQASRLLQARLARGR